MKLRMMSFLMALMVCTYSHGQVAASEARCQNLSKFAGVWRGQLDKLPGVDLVITDEGGEMHGGILFFFHVRSDANSRWTSTPGLPEPLFNLKQDAAELAFQVSHHRAHPPATLHDPFVPFRLKLIAPNRAELVNENHDGPPLILVRSDY